MKSHDSYKETSAATKQVAFFSKERSNTFFNKTCSQFFVPQKGSAISVFPKLIVNRPNDEYEKEADAVADQIVQRLAMPDVLTKKEAGVQTKSLASTISPLVQRKCASCEQEEKLQEKKEEDLVQESRPEVRRKPIFESNAEPPDDINNIQRKCAECEKEEKLQKKQNSSDSTTVTSPIESSLTSSKGGGTSIPTDTREQMENSFGADFSHVRLHRDSSAVQMSKDLHAQAFTVGSDIYFNAGKYDTNSLGGKQLLAHELTHVLQQTYSSPSSIRRKECTSNRVCCPKDKCSEPDSGEAGTEVPSTSWTLTINIDIEADDFESALRKKKLGHTHVRFSESNGKQYTYGFYPANEIPNENKRGVEGCVNHPDTLHDPCADKAVTFFLTEAQYKAGLVFANQLCNTGHYYGLNAANVSYTCTTFAEEVARAAGKSLPKSASKPTTIYYQPVPAIDNPNTLHENLPGEGFGSDAELLNFIQSVGPNVIKAYPRQEKIRWITMLLEGWITDTDVAAVEKICKSTTDSSELNKIKTAVDPLVGGMNTEKQRNRVRNALDGK